MALTLSELQAKRDAIIAQMDRPQEQHHGDRGLTRRSIADLEKALALIDVEIAEATVLVTGTRRSRIVRVTTDKGF